MKQYLYILNYAPEEAELCHMEFQELFHEPMTSSYYVTSNNFDYQRSVYMRGKLEIFYHSSSFEEILQKIKDDHLCFYDFKVIYLKNEITHVHYEETIEKCKQLAFPIDGSVDLHHPKVILALTKFHDQWVFGKYEERRTWHHRINKPYQYSHSLNVRDARTLVNIAIGDRLGQSLVDPCCGIGTVVLEALSMGISIKGYDINRDVVHHAKKNLEYFGYDPSLIERKDIHDIDEHYDIAIMDIPYGIYSPFSYQQQLSLIKQATRISKRLLLVSHQSMNQELVDLGYAILNQCHVRKSNFLRYITLCERKKP